jgi:hypothetical protein
MGVRTAVSVVGALAARWYLSRVAGNMLASRIELANAFTGLRGLLEGQALMELGMSPYAGAVLR